MFRGDERDYCGPLRRGGWISEAQQGKCAHYYALVCIGITSSWDREASMKENARIIMHWYALV